MESDKPATKTILVRNDKGEIVKKTVQVKTQDKTGAKTLTEKKNSSFTAKVNTVPNTSMQDKDVFPVEEEKEKKKKSFAWAIPLVILFFISTLAFGALYFLLNKDFTNSKSAWELKETSLNDSITVLNKKYLSLKAENDSLKDVIANPEKNEALQTLIVENTALKEKITKLQRGLRRNSTTVNRSADRKIIKELKEKVETLEQEIERLLAENKKLVERNNKLLKKVSSAEVTTKKLTTKNKELEKEIDEAAKLEISELTANGVKFKSASNTKIKTKAKSVDKLQVTFNVLPNKLSTKSIKEAYIVVTGPNGKTIGPSDLKVAIGDEEINYSVLKTVDFNGEQVSVKAFVEKGANKFLPGNYNTSVYIDNALVGEVRFDLK